MKYFKIYKMSIKQEKDTIVDVLLSAISFLIIIFIFLQLWQFIYDGGELINGFSLKQMIWYLIITELIYYVSKVKDITIAFNDEIKSGSIAYKLNKPYNYYIYQIFNSVAKSNWKMLFYCPIAVALGFLLVGNIPSFSWYQILPCFVSIILAAINFYCLYGIVAVFAFWIEDTAPFVWIMQKFLMLFGLMFPITFFPSWIQPIIKYSPIYSISSGVGQIVADFSWESFMWLTVSQVVWIVIMLIVGVSLYNLGKKKVNINGG